MVQTYVSDPMAGDLCPKHLFVSDPMAGDLCPKHLFVSDLWLETYVSDHYVPNTYVAFGTKVIIC